jgi:hypothetical protein
MSTGEMFDPSTGQFTLIAQVMNALRQSGPTATLLPSGKVLVAGGDSNEATAELFDYALGFNGSFGLVSSPMSAARGHHTATLITGGRFQGRVLLAGNSGATDSNTGELYDPAGGSNGTFTVVDNTMSEGRYGSAAIALSGGKVLLAAGANRVGMIRSTVLFDSAAGTNGTFATGNPLLVARKTPTATPLSNGKILIAAGSNDRSADLYDVATGTVTSAGTMVAQRQYQAAALLDNGQVLIVGGSDANGPLASAELYVY